MNKEELKLHDVIVIESTKQPVQYFGEYLDNGVVVQDIHTKRTIMHIGLVRKATKTEVGWFAKMDEHINPIKPSNL